MMSKPNRAKNVLLFVLKVLKRFNSLGQVGVELGHAGREERVNHRAWKQATQVCLEETKHLSFAGLPGKVNREKIN